MEFSLDLWDPIRSRGIPPTFVGPLSDSPELRTEFLVGARHMGYELVDLDDHATIAAMAAEHPPRFPLQPQQLWIADSLNALGIEDEHGDSVDEGVVEAMRRASKTTTIFLWCLGRCLCRPNYQVTFSAQSGVKSSARLREWKGRLDRTCPDPEALAGIPYWKRGMARPQPAATARHTALFGDELLPPAPEPVDEYPVRPFRILMGETGKGIYFVNGSQFLVFKPDADAYRGEAGDVSWIDEAQELDPETAEDLLAGIVPLQDTKPGAALVISGTAGEVRVGPLWERVDKLRDGDPDTGGADYCFPPDTPWEMIEDEDAAMRLIMAHHPGVNTLTTIPKMRKNWRKLTKPKWAREYGSLWPETFGVRAIPAEKWADCAHTGRRWQIPERAAFGLAIKPGGGVACIAAAWRNSRGVAFVEILEHRSGTHWIPEYGAALTMKHRRGTIAYDDIAEGKATATEIAMSPRRAKLRIQTYRETAAGCVQIMRDIERGTLRHLDDVSLNSAVASAAKREAKNDSGVWLWTPAEFGDDITPLDAATRALRNWDQHYAAKRPVAGSVMGQ